jgi:hypothetical protein
MHSQKWHTRNPKDKETNHRRRINALTLRNLILESQEGGPDSANHDTNGIRAVHVLDGEPEDGEDGARDDGDVGAPEPPGSARDYGEGYVVQNADCAV